MLEVVQARRRNFPKTDNAPQQCWEIFLEQHSSRGNHLNGTALATASQNADTRISYDAAVPKAETYPADFTATAESPESPSLRLRSRAAVLFPCLRVAQRSYCPPRAQPY